MKKQVYSFMTERAGGAGVIRAALGGVSSVYGCAVQVRKWAYRRNFLPQVRLARPVISVGNLTVGGVGKTPVVEAIARFVGEMGYRPVILTRGYAGGDEAAMLQRSLSEVPVVVGKDRVAGARKVLDEHPADVFILDDGFQHLRVIRDLDIAVVDATNPFGNGHLLPRGTLREPLPALSRSNLVILTRTDLPGAPVERIREELKKYFRGAVVESVHEPYEIENLATGEKFSTETLKDRAVVLISGIGNPEAFRLTVEGLGARVKDEFEFMDHHAYTQEELSEVEQSCRDRRIKTIVTTAKDAVKMPAGLCGGNGVDIWVLKIRIRFTWGEDELVQRIVNLLQR